MGKTPSGTGPAAYAVGRGKPPRHTRFQPGRSGNPGGRRKESLNNRTILESVLNSEIVLSDHGRTRTVTLREALVLRCAQSGLAGDQRSIEYLLNKGELLDGLTQTRSSELEQDDLDLLDAALLARRRSGRPASGAQRSPGVDEPDEVASGDVRDEDDGSDEPDGSPPPRRSGTREREGRS